MYAYCFNNPVNMADSLGNWPQWAKKLVAAVAVVAVVTVVAVATGGTGVVAAVAAGAAKGAAVGLATGAIGGFATGYVATGTIDGALNGMSDGALSGAVTGAVIGGINGGLSYSPGTTGTTTTPNNIPNPNGRKGGAAHQAEIARQTAKYNPSQVNYEVKIPTPGGSKPYRYADFSVTENGNTWYGNVGRQLKSGLPCARERYAITDIQGAGRTIKFFPYN